MCIVFWYVNAKRKEVNSNKIQFLVLFNREEWYKRPTKPLSMYENEDVYYLILLRV